MFGAFMLENIILILINIIFKVKMNDATSANAQATVQAAALYLLGTYSTH